MDAGNMLKPALARGNFQCCGATTVDEFRLIERDAALARRFQPIHVNQPSVKDTITILRGLRERYEVHHGVRISDSALIAAATYSDRYISDRFLPDKAIDLVDESCSRLRLEQESRPDVIEVLDGAVLTLQIELESLKREPSEDRSSRERLVVITAEIQDKKVRRAELEATWSKEK